MALLDLIQTSPAFLVFVCVVLGLLVGSFLNVVIHRLPKMMERDWEAQCADLRGETTAARQPNATTSWCRAPPARMRAHDHARWRTSRC